LVLLAGTVACGATRQHGAFDGAAGDGGADGQRDVGAPEAAGEATSGEDSGGADAPTDSMDAPAKAGGTADGSSDAMTDSGAGDAPETADGAVEAGDPRCPDPGPGACVCDGFVMPNPAGAGLPNPAQYEASDAGVVVDDVSGLVWEKAPSATEFAQPDAIAHCLTVRTGGHADWRLPTAVELVSIVDFVSTTRALDARFDLDTIGDSWTSTLAGNPTTGLVVAFTVQFSETALVDIVDHLPARCVRTGGAPAPRCYRAGARYALDSDDVATDRATGLVWQRHVLPTPMSWNAARTACAADAGSGWRLPSVHALQTIVDHTANAPSIDSVVFPGTPVTMNQPSSFWTSSPSAYTGNGTEAWIVDFVSGYSTTGPISTLGHVRCVR
jgi:hypothetical protein